MDSEREMILDFFHEHPFTRISETRMSRKSAWCCGCWRWMLPGEAVYGCSDDKCEFPRVLHEECLEMGRVVRHRLHPSHPLTQVDLTRGLIGTQLGKRCAVCDEDQYTYGELGYVCSRGCDFWIHFKCAFGEDGDEEQETQMKEHPSHPLHKLKIMRRSSSFKCDACGITHENKGYSYICSDICQYWIHESCANLPTTARFNCHHPDHDLSLAFRLPLEYLNYEYSCDICRGTMGLKQWLYHCHLCRYLAHINCITNSMSNDVEVHEPKGILEFPINDDMYEELIRGLVVREAGTSIPHEDDNEIITSNGMYNFHSHHHPLRKIMSSSSYNKEEEEEEEDDECNGRCAELRCDGCTRPILSSSSYMSCDECDYLLHLSCFKLPRELPSLPLHSIKGHNLRIQITDKVDRRNHWPRCSMCSHVTNGLLYVCTKCSFKVDIKCASLPTAVKHAGHPNHQHFLKLLLKDMNEHNRNLTNCGACFNYIRDGGVYKCDRCRYCVCLNCALLPAVLNEHESEEKHGLPLTYDANVNHEGDFYCGICEGRMNPKEWKYHCRQCDQSYHTKCFPTTSGEYRNINFGRKKYYANVTTSAYHQPHHPLRFQVVTKKKRCDLCRLDAYGFGYRFFEGNRHHGFQCASCNFVMCFYPCGKDHIQLS